jgi:RNA polymerase sigma-70 factor, ECF subfamily
MSVAIVCFDDLVASIQLATMFGAQASTPNTDDGDDRALVARIATGDRRAASQLFRRHADDVYRRLTRLVGPDSEREDLMQEVFIAAFRGLEHFRGDAQFSTWLYTVVVRTAYAHLRKRKKRPLDLDAAVDALPIDPDASPEARATQREQVRRALAFLEKLKPQKRIAFVLRTVEGMSLAEIAVLVDSTPAAVGQRVKHAQRELNAMIEREAKRTRKDPR